MVMPRIAFWGFFMKEFNNKTDKGQDAFYMQMAIELAKKGRGFTSPNPLVGAVIVKNNIVIGEGYHEYYGGPHAEVNAIKNANSDINGATIYLTLEPCSHYGKTPPCSLAIIQNKLSRVVIGSLDPNPLVSGKGIEMIRNAGIRVDTGILEQETQKLNEVFFKFIQTKEPFILMKTAMSLDGKIATRNGDSKWISGEQSRSKVHQMRNEYSAIMVGINTVINDNPLLNVRNISGKTKNPIRIIIDSKARTPLDADIVNTPEISPVIVAVTKKAKKENIDKLSRKGIKVIVCPEKEKAIDLKYLIKEIGKLNIDSILLEGGGTLNFGAIEQNIVDKVITFISPKIIGGKEAATPVEGVGFKRIADTVELEKLNYTLSGNDIMVEGYIKKN